MAKWGKDSHRPEALPTPPEAPRPRDSTDEFVTDEVHDHVDGPDIAELQKKPETADSTLLSDDSTPKGEAEHDSDADKAARMTEESRAEALKDRPSLEELHKAAYEGREVEISKAVSWAGPYVAGVLYVGNEWRRYHVGTVKNMGDAALKALASDPTILVRWVG